MLNKRERSNRSYRIGDKMFPYLLMLPSLIPIAVILIYPIFRTAWMSFFKIATQKPNEGTFVGFSNYMEVLSGETFSVDIKNTAILTVVTVVFSILIGLGLALALNQKLPGKSFFRSLIIIPWATPQVAAVLVWLWLFDYQFGFVNYAFRSLGLTQQNIGWLVTAQMAMPSLCVVMIWKYFSISCIMLLAGLQTIDTTLYEVARVDGANPLRQFWHITLPGLRESGSVLILLVTIWCFREFTTVKLLTNGGPARATETLVLSTYLNAFNYYKMGTASAMGMITFFISLVFSAAYFMLFKRRKNDL